MYAMVGEIDLCFVKLMISLRIATEAISTELHGALALDRSLLTSPGILCNVVIWHNKI